MSSIRVVLGLTASLDLELEQLDVKTAFLHGDLNEEIYMSQPEGFEVKGKEHMVFKLKKSLYGLKQAPRQWYKKFDEKEKMASIPYYSVVGSLMYCMVCTRPDIAHAVSTVSRFLSNSGKEHWEAVKWIFKYLRGTSKLCLSFGGSKPVLEGFTNANMAGDLDGRK